MFIRLDSKVSSGQERGAVHKPTMRRVRHLCLVICLAFLPVSGDVCAAEAPKYQPVLALKPVGYWPADEGEGAVLYDRSGHENHGTIYHTPWANGLLQFSSGFQWVEIPGQDAYARPAVTVGGWLFTRRASYQRLGMLFMGIANPRRTWSERSLFLRMREGGELEVFSGEADDAIGSAADKRAIPANAWQHVVYTYEGGAGKLYLNGKLVQSKMGVAYTPQKLPVLIGCDADWWMLNPPASQSLDGSVRELVLFDRALSADEVAGLHKATRPSVTPKIFTADALVVDNQEIPVAELSNFSQEEQRRALAMIDRWPVEQLRQQADVVLVPLTQALATAPTRRLAARLLGKLGRPEANEALTAAVPQWIQSVQDPDALREDRVASALALADMKGQAQVAVPALVAVLEESLGKETARMPRVEDVLRNAVTQALISIAPRDKHVRTVLGRALAKPALETIDLSKPELAEVKQLVGEGRYLDALDCYRTMPSTVRTARYFSQGDPNTDARGSGNVRAYTPKVTRNGVSYVLGYGKDLESLGAEPISQEDFAQAVQRLAPTVPGVAAWRKPDAPHLYRLKINKIAADGTVRTSYLEGEDFIFDGTDGKVRGWSIIVDEKGYIHIIGGQHNMPNPELFIPGSWEKIGISRDNKVDTFPNQLYWVSARPGDISEFEFVGHRNNPRQIPSPGYLNYMNLVQDQHGATYLYGRIDAFGWQTWGFYRYDVDARRWSTIGGDPCDVLADVQQADPTWGAYCIRQVRGTIPTVPGTKALVWAWQPNFYNYCRSQWGVYFDQTNRLHLRVPIRAIDARARIVDRDLYAYSDDGGTTFHRADGSSVELPLTANPAPSHLATVESHNTQEYWELWTSLLRYAGY